jgi:ElaB/YqjD/DUF883 family membrane-anchored ribosome-binding protein
MTPEISGTMERTFTCAEAEVESPLHEKGIVAEKVAQGRQKAERYVRATKDRAVELEDRFEGYVQERPLKALLVAAGVGAGVGLLLGALIGRR